MPSPRVVLDNNTVLMPLIRPGSSHRWLMDAWWNEQITPLISQETREELLRKLRDPRFKIPEEMVPIIASEYLDYCETVAIPDPPPLTPKCRDATDQKFIELAQQGEAQYLVSNDPDLLVMKDQMDQNKSEAKFAIIKPAELFAIIQAKSPATG